MAHPYTHEELVSYCLHELEPEKARSISEARIRDYQLDAELKELQQILHLSRQESIKVPPSGEALSRFRENHKTTTKRRFKVAAALIGFLLLSSLSLLFLPERSKAIVLSAQDQMETFELPDGSVITLDAGSSISYQDNFVENRSLELLEGKAFFDVVKQSGDPFLVEAGSSEVTVLGTRFDVQLNTQEIQVNLQEGSVSFSCPAGEVLLEPMQQALFTSDELHLNKNLAPRVFHWTKHQLHFNETPLTEVVILLQERFNEDVQVSSTSGNCTLTGSFSEEKLQDILDVIAITINGEISNSPTGFLIESPGC